MSDATEQEHAIADAPAACPMTGEPHRWGGGRAKNECDDCDAPRPEDTASAIDPEAELARVTQLRPESDAEVYAVGLIYASVCATNLEAAERALILYPTGLDHGWRLAQEAFRGGSANGGVCDQAPNRRHWLFTC